MMIAYNIITSTTNKKKRAREKKSSTKKGSDKPLDELKSTGENKNSLQT